MVDDKVREASQRAAAERARQLDENGVPQRGNHPGSRYGEAPEDRPDLAREVEPLVKADVRPEDVPDAVPGGMPENRGEDPGDVHRDRPERPVREGPPP